MVSEGLIVKDVMELNGKEFHYSKLLREKYGVTQSTLTAWVNRNMLPTPVVLGNRYYYQADRIEELMLRRG